jgi:N-acetylmuramoyl-L-alanine amidase
MRTRRKFITKTLGAAFASLCSASASELEATKNLVLSALKRDDPTVKVGNPMRIAIVVGHNSEDRGARGKGPIKGCEWDFWAMHSAAMQEAFNKFGCEAKTYFRKRSSSYTAETTACYSALVNEMQPHGIIELHYNCAGRTAPKGTISIHGGSVKAAVLADACQTAMEETLSKSGENRALLDWSKVECRKSGRGATALKVSGIPTVILEPAFAASNPTEADILKTYGEEMCWAVAKSVSCAKLPLIS